MDQLRAVWSGLDLRRRVIVAIATLAMFAAVLVFSRLASTPDYALLFGGLAPSAAGEIITNLEQQNIPYEVRGNSIYVKKSLRDQLRMTLAAKGLPSKGIVGYELLDSLSGFSTTSQMFDAAYWRAKEGELARTMLSSPQIKAARVLIAAPSSQPFHRGATPTASVAVRTVSGGLSAAQAKALRSLVAGAVTGMKPENVAVIDSDSGLIAGPDEPGQPSAAAASKALQLKHNIERILDARVGFGNAVAEVSVDTVTDGETLIEKRVDPASRVTVSTDKSDQSSSSSLPQGGAVTVASNLPTGSGANPAGRNASENTRTRERINYEFSQSKREIRRPPGAIRRITVAVLINGIRKTASDGSETWQPRSAEEIATLRDLVRSTMGFDAKRGDMVTIRSLPFEALPQPGGAPKTSLISSLGLDYMTLVKLALLGVLALLLGLFVLRPILTGSRGHAFAKLPPPALDGEIDSSAFEPAGLQVVSPDSSAAAGGADGEQPPEADPVVRLRKLIEERQDETVDILRSWMEEGEETA